MSDEELEKLAELIFQKLVKKEQDYIDSIELPFDWVHDTTSGIWYTVKSYEDCKYTKELLMQRLISLNIEKQELINKEEYEGLVKLQLLIDEIKEELKKYKD